MVFEPFYSRFPELAMEETRSATVFNDPDIPADTYGFMESFCTDPKCDCRRVFLTVLAHDDGQPVATLGWGWEDYQYYLQWGHGDPTIADELTGLSLPMGTYQKNMRLSEAFLELTKRILQDRKYAERIKRHYAMWRKALRDGAALPALKPVTSGPRVGRNDPCACGSGKKFKKSCMA